MTRAWFLALVGAVAPVTALGQEGKQIRRVGHPTLDPAPIAGSLATLDADRLAPEVPGRGKLVVPLDEVTRALARDAGWKRTGWQLAGGSVLGAAALGVAFTTALGCDDGACNGTTPALVVLDPAAGLLASSATVYWIGERFDRPRHGRFAPTLAGALAGAAAAAVFVTVAMRSDQVDNGDLLTYATLASAAVGPTVGAVIGYNRSRPRQTRAFVSIEQGRLGLGVPEPALRLAQVGRSQSIQYRLNLMEVGF